MRVRLTVFAMVLALAGCQLVSGKTAPSASGPQALQTTEITVETLGAPGLAPDATPETAPDTTPGTTADTTPDAVPEASSAIPPGLTDPTGLPGLTKPAAIFISPRRLACEKQGGAYVIVGKSGALACQTRTIDAGKSCDNSGECEGSCLARSRSCAPVKPLFGCNEVLEIGGRRVSLCID